jgi:hypothetical protein
MPVTQRWVHGGLVVTVVMLSLCLTVLIAGHIRNPSTDIGLLGARAATFSLQDTAGRAASLDAGRATTVLVFAERESRGYTEHLESVNRLIGAHMEDHTVQFLGISYVMNPSLLGPNGMENSVLEIHCPKLRVARDNDGAVARAYRVHGAPTLVIVDSQGIIRGRVSLDNESAIISATETINSLRPDHRMMPTMISRVSASSSNLR